MILNPDLHPCPEGIRHGPADRTGRCPWCHLQVAAPIPRQRYAGQWWPQWRQDQEDAYRRHYDPDWGTLRVDTDPWQGAGWMDL